MRDPSCSRNLIADALGEAIYSEATNLGRNKILETSPPLAGNGKRDGKSGKTFYVEKWPCKDHFHALAYPKGETCEV
uniref:Retrotransposon protein n=1 Tax=Steinernema glaseri TaxID=37863 RepID=A0A1I8AHW0_9BILA